MMGKRHNRTGKRLRLIPLILGVYGALLGFGLVIIGLSRLPEGIGIIRALFGLGLACFGLYGIWDGIRDLVKPDRKPVKQPGSQFILVDTSGNRSSNVTIERLREQLDSIAESGDYISFHLQILPPLPVNEKGMLKQISCVYHDNIFLTAFFEMPDGGYQIYQKGIEPDMAEEWLKQLLAGSPDFSEWKSIETEAYEDEEPDWQDEEGNNPEEEVPYQEGMESFWQQLLTDQKGLMTNWHKLLIIFGESWHDEHKFFSGKDLELAIEGVYNGKYQKAVLEWGYEAFHIFPGRQNDLMVIWSTNGGGKEKSRFMAREGTVVQVKFWLVNYVEHGLFEEMSGWNDITAQVEKEWRKQKKHGKIF